ncbi:phosphoribosylformylglycinamidine synthase subunit PurS [Periweissella beninensis]|uniref:Phosphoribosylformylglycinamidine synthase subunit PurS n=1 Tax=Periweissella beninensis TaxID=504936 RepID=A0ABT0VFZ6_9LACO|nr:phosphoribosylformylglycinamidine synthase subunit PurS [Periweissella beninensis]MBM7543866.1 phosphoribosylformylglycinamidine synthase [Periweissella beninensis]MCM2436753.1 phosphoribosylformylglycinamidine synthase subunit PurS [Periweissella beninensis]MCT4395537.1 phosphoribosylformylglycinamidine synthase subunit PurS [Periweissella beninensis]
MYLAKIYVTYKPSILDPKGETVKDALHRLDYQAVSDVVMGKYFEIKIANDNESDVRKMVEAFSQQLLINVNMEVFRYELIALSTAV